MNIVPQHVPLPPVTYTFAKVVDERNYAYFYPVDTKGEPIPGSADNIYVTASSDWSQRGPGFGGSTVELPLTDGTVFKLRGGWHSNNRDLYSATSIDLDKYHLTRGIMSVDVIQGDRTVFVDPIHYDHTTWVNGLYDRIPRMAWCYANEHRVPVYYWFEGVGGTTLGCMFTGEYNG